MNEPDTVTLRERFARIARSLIWILELDRSRPASIARENYLRGRMGLPPLRGRRRDDAEGEA
jgi:hypothetical protein